jgi:hypothetical protein
VAGQRWWRGALDTCGQERTEAQLQTAAVGSARGEAVGGGAWSGCGRLSGPTRTVLTAPLRHGTGAWQPRSDSVLTGEPGVERGKLTGGSHVSVISEIKTLPNESSSKKWLGIEKKFQKIRGGRKSNLEHFS